MLQVTYRKDIVVEHLRWHPSIMHLQHFLHRKSLLWAVIAVICLIPLSGMPNVAFPYYRRIRLLTPSTTPTLCGVTSAKSNPENGSLSAFAMSAPIPLFNSKEVEYAKVVPDLLAYTEDTLPQVAGTVLELERQGRGRKIIAMSLFGDNPRYVSGALLNAVLAKRDWPGWVLRIYYGEGVPQEAVNTLLSLDVELVKVDLAQGSRVSMYWRFFALEDTTATRIISRDADALLTQRDLAAVNEWIESGRFFHTLHDHPHHRVPILGGMWGAVSGYLHPRIIQGWRNSSDQSNPVWGNDQHWLESVVWPLVKSQTLDHASFRCHQYGAAEWRGFPTKRLHAYDFVGNAYRLEEKFVGTVVPATCPAECRRKPEWDTC